MIKQLFRTESEERREGLMDKRERRMKETKNRRCSRKREGGGGCIVLCAY